MATLVAPSALVARIPAGQRAFDPMTLPSKFAVYLAGQGYEIGTGVKRWKDVVSGGVGHDLVNATGANQPIQDTGPNGTVCLTFDGVNDSLFTGGSTGEAQPQHQFLVAKFTASGTTGTLLDGNANKGRLQRTGTTQLSMYAGGAGLINSSATPTLTNWHLYEVFWSGAASSLIIDAGANLVSGNPGTTANDQICLGTFGNGSTDPLACSVTELWSFSAEVAGADLTNLRAYFTDKFGVP